MDATLASVVERLHDAGDTIQLVGFKISNELFGVDILTVQEIIKNTGITPVPDAADFIGGVINLRGNIIPVIDLQKRLKIRSNPSARLRTWIIILTVCNRVTGFIVDHVTRVIKVQSGEILSPPEVLSSGLESDYISGVYRVEQHGLLAILDFNRILLIDEFKKANNLKRDAFNERNRRVQH